MKRIQGGDWFCCPKCQNQDSWSWNSQNCQCGPQHPSKVWHLGQNEDRVGKTDQGEGRSPCEKLRWSLGHAEPHVHCTEDWWGVGQSVESLQKLSVPQLLLFPRSQSIFSLLSTALFFEGCMSAWFALFARCWHWGSLDWDHTSITNNGQQSSHGENSGTNGQPSSHRNSHHCVIIYFIWCISSPNSQAHAQTDITAAQGHSSTNLSKERCPSKNTRECAQTPHPTHSNCQMQSDGNQCTVSCSLIIICARESTHIFVINLFHIFVQELGHQLCPHPCKLRSSSSQCHCS